MVSRHKKEYGPWQICCLCIEDWTNAHMILQKHIHILNMDCCDAVKSLCIPVASFLHSFPKVGSQKLALVYQLQRNMPLVNSIFPGAVVALSGFVSFFCFLPWLLFSSSCTNEHLSPKKNWCTLLHVLAASWLVSLSGWADTF